jgi:hypothetical protein
MAKRTSMSDAGETKGKPVRSRTRTPGAAKAPRSADAINGAGAASMAPSAPDAGDPSEDDIRFHAYLRYVERGRDDGGAFDDWLHAERELKKGT